MLQDKTIVKLEGLIYIQELLNTEEKEQIELSVKDDESEGEIIESSEDEEILSGPEESVIQQNATMSIVPFQDSYVNMQPETPKANPISSYATPSPRLDPLMKKGTATGRFKVPKFESEVAESVDRSIPEETIDENQNIVLQSPKKASLLMSGLSSKNVSPRNNLAVFESPKNKEPNFNFAKRPSKTPK